MSYNLIKVLRKQTEVISREDLLQCLEEMRVKILINCPWKNIITGMNP
jgi:hypothetical protein